MDQNLFGSRSGIGYIPGAIKEWAEVIEKKAERLEVNGMSIYKGLVIGRLKKFEKRDGATTTLIMSCVYDEFSTVQFESTNTVRQTILNSLEEGMAYSVAFSTYKNFDKSIILKVADIQPILEKDFSLTKELFATEIHFSRAFHNLRETKIEDEDIPPMLSEVVYETFPLSSPSTEISSESSGVSELSQNSLKNIFATESSSIGGHLPTSRNTVSRLNNTNLKTISKYGKKRKHSPECMAPSKKVFEIDDEDYLLLEFIKVVVVEKKSGGGNHFGLSDLKSPDDLFTEDDIKKRVKKLLVLKKIKIVGVGKYEIVLDDDL